MYIEPYISTYGTAMQKQRLLVLFSFVLFFITACSQMELPKAGSKAENILGELWNHAIQDAAVSNDNEIMPLVTLTAKDRNVQWNKEKNAVLLGTFHAYSFSDNVNKSFPAWKKPIWAVSVRELKNWYEKNKASVENWQLRLAQVLGLPADYNDTKGYEYFTLFWVRPEHVIRPAYITDVKAQMKNGMQHIQDTEYKKWFEQNYMYSNVTGHFPWTRLGYSYDWGNPEQEYGLTEFLIQDPEYTTIVYSFTVPELIEWLEKYEIH